MYANLTFLVKNITVLPKKSYVATGNRTYDIHLIISRERHFYRINGFHHRILRKILVRKVSKLEMAIFESLYPSPRSMC